MSKAQIDFGYVSQIPLQVNILIPYSEHINTNSASLEMEVVIE